MSRIGLALCGALLLFPAHLAAQDGPGALPTVQELMSPAQLDSTGLSKLTPQELSAFNAWLARYTAAIAQLVIANARGNATSSADASSTPSIESRIDGQFEGWTGETVFKLQNGQIWQQASYAYTYHYAYSPGVLIYRDGALYKMRVDGVDATIAVRRIK